MAIITAGNQRTLLNILQGIRPLRLLEINSSVLDFGGPVLATPNGGNDRSHMLNQTKWAVKVARQILTVEQLKLRLDQVTFGVGQDGFL